MSRGDILSIFCGLRWMPQDLIDDKSTLFDVMAWCHQTASHYLNQCWWCHMVSLKSSPTEAETKWLVSCRWHFQMHFLEWISLQLIQISPNFVLKGPIDNIPSLIPVMAWWQTGNKGGGWVCHKSQYSGKICRTQFCASIWYSSATFSDRKSLGCVRPCWICPLYTCLVPIGAGCASCARWSRSLQWQHNGHGSVSNHQPNNCLLNRLFRRRSKKTLKLYVTGLCAGNLPGTSDFPAQMASNAENVWWSHHGVVPVMCRHQEVLDYLPYLLVMFEAWMSMSSPWFLLQYGVVSLM